MNIHGKYRNKQKKILKINIFSRVVLSSMFKKTMTFNVHNITDLVLSPSDMYFIYKRFENIYLYIYNKLASHLNHLHWLRIVLFTTWKL